MNLFELSAKLSLDSSAFSKGISTAKNAVGTFGKVAAATFAAGTAAFTAFATDAVRVGADFDEAMSQVAATMGVTTEEIQNLREFAKEMGASTKFSATESAEALNYMALAGYNAEKSMEMLPTVLNLAAAGGMQLANASDMVTDAESALGLTSEETAAMVDQMAKAASKSNTSVTQLGDAILTIGGTAKFMAGGTDRLQTVLGLLADNGIKGSEAGTHLRNMLLKLSTPTEDGALAMEELGLNVFDSSGNMRDMQDIIRNLNKAFDGMTDEKRIEYISKLFNSRDIAAVNALLGTSEERWNELGAAIADASGAAQQMADTQLDNLTGDITIMKSAWEGVRIEFSEGLMPVLRNIVQKVTGWLSNPKTMQFIKDLGEKTGALVEKIVNWLEKIIPYVIDAVKSLWPVFKEVFGNVSEVVGKVAGYALDAFKKVLPKISDMIKKAIALVQKIAPPVTKFVKSLMPSLKSIVQTLTKVGKSVLPVVVNLVKKMAPVVKQVFDITSKIVKTVAPLLQKMLKFVGQVLGDIVSDVSAFVKSWGPAIVGVIKGITNFLQPVFDILTKIHKTVNTILGPVKSLIGSVGKAIGDVTHSTADANDEIDETAERLKHVTIEYAKLSEEVENNGKGISEAAQAYKDLDEQFASSYNDAEKENKHISDLKAELDKLVDSKGRVNDADLDRAHYITDQLEDLTGKEIEWNGNVISNYEELTSAIEDSIKARRAGALLEGAEQRYDLAQEMLPELQKKIFDAQAELSQKEAALAEAEAVKNEKWADYEAALDAEWAAEKKYWANPIEENQKAWENATAAVTAAKEAFDDVTPSYNSAKKAVKDAKTEIAGLEKDEALHYKSIAEYEQAYLEFAQGNYDAVNEIFADDIATRYKHVAEVRKVTDEELDVMRNEMELRQNIADRYEQKYLEGVEGYNAKGLAEARKHAKEMVDAYELAIVNGNKSLLEEARSLGVSFVDGFATGIKSMAQAAAKQAREMAQGAVDMAKRTLEIRSPSRVTRGIGRYFGEGFEEGIIDEVDAVKNAVGYMSDAAVDAFGNPISGEGSGVRATGSNRVEQLLQAILDNMGVDIVLDDGTIAGRVDRILGQSAMRKARGGV